AESSRQGKAIRPRRAGPVPSVRRPCPSQPRRIAFFFLAGERQRQARRRPGGFDQGQRLAAVLRLIGARALRDRGSERREIRLLHAGLADPDPAGTRAAPRRAGFFPGSALALSGVFSPQIQTEEGRARISASEAGRGAAFTLR